MITTQLSPQVLAAAAPLRALRQTTRRIPAPCICCCVPSSLKDVLPQQHKEYGMGFRQTGILARARQCEYGKLQASRMATVLRAAEANEVQTDPKKGPPNAMALVKKLRERTANSIGLCKQALQASNWDEEAAVAYLRKSGIAQAAKTAHRKACEGLVSVFGSVQENSWTAVALNCETDFVQRTPQFVAFSQALAEHFAHLSAHSADTPDLEQLRSSEASESLSSSVCGGSGGPGGSVGELLMELAAKFGEKVDVTAATHFQGNLNSCVNAYVHGEVAPGVGRAAAVVELCWAVEGVPAAAQNETLRDRLFKFAKLLAMQAVATQAKYLSADSIPASLPEKEHAAAAEPAAKSANEAATPEAKAAMPSNVSQLLQHCLQDQGFLTQEFLMMAQARKCVLAETAAAPNATGDGNDGPLTVADAVQLVAKKLGCSLSVVRMQLVTVRGE